ncbi:MAG: LuxR C-terminal-related transcriptional regulator [Acidobacteriia bacterium]|nr:LuxR C-terminal-related transcriptional regulator [Terriglobia bacterium]
MVIGPAAALDQGREAFRKQAWSAAFSNLSSADREAPLEPEDLQRLAIAGHLTGRDAESADILIRAHQGFLAGGDTQSAARCAFWLGFGLLNNGELAQAGGWFARARRLLDDGHLDCVEQGYLLLPDAIRAVHQGDTAGAYHAFVKAASIGERFGDNDLVTSARMGQGRALIRQGEVARGVSLLDEAMVAVTAGEVSPVMAGGVYCSVLEVCGEILDLRRAQEWTSALERWHTAQPDVVPYRGHCMVRRAEILQLQGDWPGALDQAQQACERLLHPPPKAAVGPAFYRRAELHRLRGEFAQAEEAYRQANQWERTPQPGLAQLRMAQGQVDSANSAIRHVAEAVREPGQRARVLDAYVEIVLAVHDVPAARAAADELAEIASRLNAPWVDAMSARANGAVLLAEQDARGALTTLRQALTAWRDLEAPYEAARVRVLIALACREVGDCDTADGELAAARDAFQQLGATPAVAQVEALSRKQPAGAGGSLTSREVEVLKLVASGMTNRGIAGKLRISEKTVARHLSNIFNKLDLSSRAAATAYAYQHNLV